MDEKQLKADMELSEMINSMMFMALLVWLIGWSIYFFQKRGQEQDECWDRGGFVEEVPGRNQFDEDSWRCAMEDRD